MVFYPDLFEFQYLNECIKFMKESKGAHKFRNA